MIYPIYMYGSSVLKKKSSIIYKNDIDIKKLGNDMFETMEYAEGIGLAAPQIGKSIRIFVIDGSSLNDSNMLNFKKIFVNPTIINQYGEEWEFEEGIFEKEKGVEEKRLWPEGSEVKEIILTFNSFIMCPTYM